ncbi:MAG TPA: DICT sensory domain-containing protein [Nocardioides sp.]|nr:DICT sensory domain-containing protein [Nocardioides sp.]
MHTPSNSGPDQDQGADLLSIGELAERTGVAVATLRAWETRHGFPAPLRRESGHRRYRAADVDLVRSVRDRRDAGVRLDVAIERTLAVDEAPVASNASVYAELRRARPDLTPYRLRKATLNGLSHAIEDELLARADRPYLFGAFQSERHYAGSRERWAELARVAAGTYVIADFHDPDLQAPAREVPLAGDAALRREWAVVCVAVELPVALSAWELPGQRDVPERDRVFEVVWTVEPDAARLAARVCARVARDSGAGGAGDVLDRLEQDPPTGGADLRAVTALMNRIVAYVDSSARG